MWKQFVNSFAIVWQTFEWKRSFDTWLCLQMQPRFNGWAGIILLKTHKNDNTSVFVLFHCNLLLFVLCFKFKTCWISSMSFSSFALCMMRTCTLLMCAVSLLVIAVSLSFLPLLSFSSLDTYHEMLFQNNKSYYWYANQLLVSMTQTGQIEINTKVRIIKLFNITWMLS